MKKTKNKDMQEQGLFNLKEEIAKLSAKKLDRKGQGGKDIYRMTLNFSLDVQIDPKISDEELSMDSINEFMRESMYRDIMVDVSDKVKGARFEITKRHMVENRVLEDYYTDFIDSVFEEISEELVYKT